MALVAYDDSGSEEEASDEPNPSVGKDQSGSLLGLLANLPRPKVNGDGKKHSVKIAMPTAPEVPILIERFTS